MTDPIKKKKKKVSVNTTPNPSAVMVQVPAGKGAVRNVRANSAAGKRASKAKKAAELKKSGKRLLRSEEIALKKSFNAKLLKKKKK